MKTLPFRVFYQILWQSSPSQYGNYRISSRVTMTILNLWCFFIPSIAGADFEAAFVANSWLYAVPTVDLRANCFLRFISAPPGDLGGNNGARGGTAPGLSFGSSIHCIRKPFLRPAIWFVEINPRTLNPWGCCSKDKTWGRKFWGLRPCLNLTGFYCSTSSSCGRKLETGICCPA